VCGLASAHPIDLGRVDLKVEDRDARLVVELNPLQAALILGVPPAQITKGRVIQDIGGGASLSADGVACAIVAAPVVEQVDQSLNVSWRMSCSAPPRSEVTLALSFLSAASPSLEMVGQAELADGSHPFTLGPARPTVSVPMQRGLQLGRFILMGIRHIGATPSEWHGPSGFHFPEGIDHILFVVALVLGGGGLRRILLTVTGFTLGHSVTLALAATGLVNVPSRWVEPAIALSIIYVAIEDLLKKETRGRWSVAFAFGLVHGLGFASALRNLGLRGSSLAQALVGFNVGVELGQATIVLCLAPLLIWLNRGGVRAQWAGRALSVPIIVLATIWFFQRSAALF
jgi:hypothetical protein